MFRHQYNKHDVLVGHQVQELLVSAIKRTGVYDFLLFMARFWFTAPSGSNQVGYTALQDSPNRVGMA
jgi:hypothetical protein